MSRGGTQSRGQKRKAKAGSGKPGGVPLCVDLDGTLIRSDLLLESFLTALKNNPLVVFLAPL